jgi:endonuclease YncB( thermonuclease family)/ribosomal protein S17E
MSNKTPIGKYNKLVSDISLLYEKGRRNFIRMYWNIGKYIDTVEQEKSSQNLIENNLIRRLSKDLMEKYGKGFSVTNLKNMRLFYKMYSFGQISDRLEWSNYVTLLSVKDPEEREAFEKKVVDEGLTNFQLRRLVTNTHRLELMNKAGGKETSQLTMDRGLLYTYSLIAPSRLPHTGNAIVIDCGFNIWKTIPVKNKEELHNTTFIRSKKNKNSYRIKPAGDVTASEIYTYKAYIEKVIDGDTLRVLVDCGFHTTVRQKLRLRGIDTPEMDTPEGRKAGNFVMSELKESPFVVIKTYKSDKYDRYLSDVFYLPGEEDIEKINREGIFLNRELLVKGMAVVM